MLNPNNLAAALVVNGVNHLGVKLCQSLLQKNCFVCLLDTKTNKNQELLADFDQNPNFNFINCKQKNYLKKINAFKINYIFYLFKEEEDSRKIAQVCHLVDEQKAKLLLISSFILSEAKKKTENFIVNYYSEHNLDIRIVRVSSIFGPGMSLIQENEINCCFYSAKYKKTFKVPGDGSKLLFPLYIDDAVRGILKAMFSRSSKGKLYSLAPKAGIPILEFLNLIKKISRFSTLGVEFNAPKNAKKEKILLREIEKSSHDLNWHPKITLEEGITLTLTWLEQLKVNLKESQKQQRKIWHKILIGVFCSILIILSPFMLFLYYYQLEGRFLIQTKEAYLKDNFVLTEKQAEKSLKTAEAGKKTLLQINPLLSLLNLKKQANYFFNFFETGINLSKLTKLSINTINEADKLTALIIKGGVGDLKPELGQMTFLLSELWDKASTLEITAGESEQQALKENLPLSREKIGLGRELINILPVLTGLESKKTYLILVQNNLELRPTGGFISSWGLLSFEKGRLLDFQFGSTNELDKELKGFVELPLPLKKYLGEKSWLLQDSNWNPDYVESSKQAEWFFEKETGRGVDGTFAFDLYFLKNLLQMLGPVEIGEKKEQITSDNFLEKVFYQSQTNEQDFLSQVCVNLFKRIKEGKNDEWFKLLTVLDQSLDSKDLLVSVHDKKAGDFFNNRGWNGAIRATSNQGKIFTDFLMLNEANLGTNRANYYLKRQLNQQITILPRGEIKEKTIIIYENLSPNEVYPGGRYKNYFRLIFPPQSKLEAIKIGPKNEDLKNLDLNKIDLFEEHNQQGIGFLVEVLPQSQLIVEINYEINNKLIIDDKLNTYAFYFQKQPGAGEDELTIEVNYPENYSVLKTAPKIEMSGSQLRWKTTTLKDSLLLINFKQN